MPVVCSAIPVFREVLSGCAIYFAPDSATDLAVGVAEAVGAGSPTRLAWAERLRAVSGRYTLDAAAMAVDRWLSGSAGGWASA